MIAVTDLQTPVGDSTPASSSQSRLAEREQLSRALVRAHQRTATAVVGVEVVDAETHPTTEVRSTRYQVRRNVAVRMTSLTGSP
jgi:hypothetical protein